MPQTAAELRALSPGNRQRIGKALLALQLCGLLLFTISFFLPAVASGDGTPQDKPFSGWICALVTLVYAWKIGSFTQSIKWLLLLSGWLNPVVIIYLVLSLLGKFARVRLFLVCAAAVCLAATWTFLFHMKILIGHDLWATGAILIALPEARRLFNRPRPS